MLHDTIYDAIYVGGAAVIFFAVPGLVTALADRRPLLPMSLMLAIGVAAMGWVWYLDPQIYALRNFPETTYRVFGAVWHSF
ncbi:hypothetical protein [Pseudooceanicola algae]|uniref:Uncharacterized protein n=1 Tax=Pseudooceanicola algae TaxID=1537215 RepID=A0A418SIM5_9RHOB|nr:hypothetical protein [Pseudooceanicola algae]QPM91151.1 hypothetical protein PSAL_024000 [Pseudooceanicola algae]